MIGNESNQDKRLDKAPPPANSLLSPPFLHSNVRIHLSVATSRTKFCLQKQPGTHFILQARGPGFGLRMVSQVSGHDDPQEVYSSFA